LPVEYIPKKRPVGSERCHMGCVDIEVSERVSLTVS
jgi:hypothetical protein